MTTSGPAILIDTRTHRFTPVEATWSNKGVRVLHTTFEHDHTVEEFTINFDHTQTCLDTIISVNGRLAPSNVVVYHPNPSRCTVAEVKQKWGEWTTSSTKLPARIRPSGKAVIRIGDEGGVVRRGRKQEEEEKEVEESEEEEDEDDGEGFEEEEEDEEKEVEDVVE